MYKKVIIWSFLATSSIAFLCGMEQAISSKLSQEEIEWWRSQLPPSRYPTITSSRTVEDGHGEAAAGVSGTTLTPPLGRAVHGAGASSCSKASSSSGSVQEFQPQYPASSKYPARLQAAPYRPVRADEELQPYSFVPEEGAEPVVSQVIPPSMEELKLLDFLKMLYAKLEQPTRLRNESLKKLQEDTGPESFDLDAREKRACRIHFTHILNVIGVMEMAHSLVMLPPYTPTDFVQKKDDFDQAISDLMAIITNDIIPDATFTSFNHYYARFLSLTSQFITIVLRRMGPNATSKQTMERLGEVNEMRVFLKSQKSF